MLDIRMLRDRPDDVRAAMTARGADVDIDAVLELDQRRRSLLVAVEDMKSRRNTVSREIGPLKKAGEDISAVQATMRELRDDIAKHDEEIRAVDESVREALLRIPNIPDATAPVGPDATGNVVVREHGEIPSFSFTPQSHVDLGEALGLFDFARAARMTGAGFPMFTGAGARLERALIQFMLDLHTREHGFLEVSPPFVCNTAAMTGTGQLPKMAEDMYRMEGDDIYLIPTAEVPLTNMYREEIIDQPLPIYLTGYTPCFRREAGAAGKETRGLLRVHQFDKVEMVKIVDPETTAAELESLVACAETVLQRLELPYRVLELCTGDLSFAAAKCYDIELWAAGQQDWLEVSSCSHFSDFQARRSGIRYRNAAGKAEFAHTLNGSGVALPRLMVALIENGQQEDGSVRLPAAIAPYFDGVDHLTAASG